MLPGCICRTVSNSRFASGFRLPYQRDAELSRNPRLLWLLALATLPAALAGAICDMKNNPSMGKRLGKKGREYAVAHHSPGAAAEKFEQLLLSALANH